MFENNYATKSAIFTHFKSLYLLSFANQVCTSCIPLDKHISFAKNIFTHIFSTIQSPPSKVTPPKIPEKYVAPSLDPRTSSFTDCSTIFWIDNVAVANVKRQLLRQRLHAFACWSTSWTKIIHQFSLSLKQSLCQ